MPNIIQRISHHFIGQLRRVAPSTAPQGGGLPHDLPAKERLSEDSMGCVEISDEITEIQKDTLPHFEDNRLSREGSSHALDRLPEVPVENESISELETLKSLRIDDALTESKKIKESYVEKPKLVNTRHLMKELLRAQKASFESDGAFEIEPCTLEDGEGSDLSEWEARFYKLDESSVLWKTMQVYGIDCVTFRISFPSDYPFSPPFVRLISPYIENGFVMNGGAICLEVLTPQGWSSAYTLEALMIQVVASLAHGGAVVSKHHVKKQHKLTKKKAEAEFKRIVKIHNKYGWVRLERNEG